MKDILRKLSTYIIYSSILFIATFMVWLILSNKTSTGWETSIGLFDTHFRIHGWIIFALSLLLLVFKIFEFTGIRTIKYSEFIIYIIQMIVIIGMVFVYLKSEVKIQTGLLCSTIAVVVRFAVYAFKKIKVLISE